MQEAHRDTYYTADVDVIVELDEWAAIVGREIHSGGGAADGL